MGLDMYLFRIKRPSIKIPDDIDESWVKNHNLLYYDEDEINDIRNVQLKPYTIEKTVNTSLINLKKIKEDFNIKQDFYAFITFMSREEVGFEFYNEEEHINIRINKKDVEEKYTFIKPIKSYIFQCEEIGYWRKNYSLQDHIYEMFHDEIENTMYQKLTKEQALEILKLGNTGYLDIPDNSDNEAYFYYEWY